MKNDKELLIFKIIAVSAALLYLYKMTKAQGGSMQGRYNPESFANLGAQLLPPEYRKKATKIGSVMLQRILN